jgi:hypothetical protein
MKAYRGWLASVLLPAVLVGGGRSAASEPDQFVRELTTSIAAGELDAVWSSLPTKHRSDVKGLINDLASNLDSEVYDRGFALAGKLAFLLKSKKDFLLASPMLSSMVPPPIMDQIKTNWGSVVDALEIAANSEIKTLAGLKKADPEKFLATTGKKLFAVIKTSVPNAAKELELAKNSKVSIVERNGDAATLKFEVEGKPATEQLFKQVEGKWLTLEMVDGWDNSMAAARADISKLRLPPETKAQALAAIKMFDAALDKLLAAPDQAAFDRELVGLVAGLGSAMGGPSPPGGAFPGPGVPPGLPGGGPSEKGAAPAPPK